MGSAGRSKPNQNWEPQKLSNAHIWVYKQAGVIFKLADGMRSMGTNGASKNQD